MSFDKYVCAAAVFAGFFLPGFCAPVQAASEAWVANPHAAVRLLSAVDGAGTLASIPAGLEVRLDDDWKTYWRSPGEAGLPPALDWAGSQNLASARLRYPAPRRITVLNIQTFGYKHDVVFPLDVVPAHPGQPIKLKLQLSLLICADLCIPENFNLALDLPASAAQSDLESTHILAQARAAVPVDERSAGISVVGARADAHALDVVAVAAQPFANPDAIPELADDAQFGAPRVTYSANGRQADFVFLLPRSAAGIVGHDIKLTILDGPRALETTRRVAAGAVSAPAPSGYMTASPKTLSLVAIIGIALLGGFILNFMPCVLPVLSLKLFHVLNQGGREVRSIRLGFLATAAGVIASFVVLAAALIGTKAAGQTIGWGIQFQQPAFIALMAVLVTIFACNLLGFFEIPLPRFAGRIAGMETDDSLIGSFLMGVLATLLATPCSAPFVGTAVGFALAGSAFDILMIFFWMGVGLAAPYILIAIYPDFAAYMPKPGRWMLFLKQGMVLPLAGTAVWLLFILAAQAGVSAAVVVALSLVAIAGVLALRRRLPQRARSWTAAAVALIAVDAVFVPNIIAAHGSGAEAQHDGIAWQPFDRSQIRSLVSQGKIVFVDVTADWCLTCEANRKFVLSTKDMAARLNTHTVPMRADWTRPDPKIGAFLASYGRFGIPFNIVYGPGAPGGIVLPELLTPGSVFQALDKAEHLHAAPREHLG